MCWCCPQRAAAELTDLDAATFAELWSEVRDAVEAIRAAYRCDGVNVGMNLGRAAGAGVPDHLHVHCLPRWDGDTNFMTAVAETRVMPESLGVSWAKLPRRLADPPVTTAGAFVAEPGAGVPSLAPCPTRPRPTPLTNRLTSPATIR